MPHMRTQLRPSYLWRKAVATVITSVLCAAASVPLASQAQSGTAPPTPPSTPRALAPFDVAGYWVAVITEDWRWRMVTPSKGDYASIPLTPAAKRVADAWDPAKDEAAGEQCRSYGAPGLMRAPTRLRFSWLDDSTLRMESDYGMQTRLFAFRSPPQTTSTRASWQGESTAQWVMAAGRGGGGGQPAAAAAPRFGTMKTVTRRLRPGYLRKNGVPYSANTVLTEHWVVHREADGSQYLVVTIVVDDPANLQQPWITAMHFRKEPDGTKWDPTPCSAKW